VQNIIPAEQGWFAVYNEGAVRNEGPMISSYPVVAWLWDTDAKKGYAVIVTEEDLISTEDLIGKFMGYQHTVQMPNPGSVPNNLGGVRSHDR